MVLMPQEQFQKFLENSKEVLILIPENPGADAIGSAWSLYFFLEKMGLFPTIAYSNNISKKFCFLPCPKNLITQVSGARDFVLSFDISRNKITNIRHEEADGKFNIYLTPQQGSIDPRDFSFVLAKFKYDLIVVLDSADLEKLGKIYLENTDLFFEVPVVNIDHKSNNDNFGQINLVDVTASSCAEILTRTFLEINPELVDKAVATCLLTGIIGATESFQKKNTTPKALSISSQLMERGADQQEIIRWLYKTQPLNILKLWGRAMARLIWEADIKLAWSMLNLDDFVQSRATSQDLPLILEKLQENYSEGKIFMAVFNDTTNSSIALIKAADWETAKKLFPALGGEIKKGFLEIKSSKPNLVEFGKEIEEKIKNISR